jgi:hypothetical protein
MTGRLRARPRSWRAFIAACRVMVSLHRFAVTMARLEMAEQARWN